MKTVFCLLFVFLCGLANAQQDLPKRGGNLSKNCHQHRDGAGNPVGACIKKRYVESLSPEPSDTVSDLAHKRKRREDIAADQLRRRDAVQPK